MTDLARRGHLGLKPEKLADDPKYRKARRKAVRAISKRRAAYLASPERQEGLMHMARVALLRCLVCGCHGVEVHHEGKPRSDFTVLPLCPAHHRREFGPGAYHYSPKAFYAEHGDSRMLLAKVADMLAGEFCE